MIVPQMKDNCFPDRQEYYLSIGSAAMNISNEHIIIYWQIYRKLTAPAGCIK
jgi:hypothetical protein